MKTAGINTILRSAILSSAVAIGLFASTSNAQGQNSYQARAKDSLCFQSWVETDAGRPV
jgi:hypothetical protein